jgi:hypothetical protein
MTYAVQAPSDNPNYPTLNLWLTGAHLDHPWFQAINNPNYSCISCLEVMEEILSVLQNFKPSHLDKKRLDFRNNLKRGASFDYRLEFLVLATLLKRGVEADFLGDGQPDIQLRLNGKDFQIEVTRRANSDIDDFQEYLEGLLENTDFVGEIIMVTRALTLDPLLRRDAKAAIEAFLENPHADSFDYVSELSSMQDFQVRLYHSSVPKFSRVNVIDSGNVTNSLQRVEGVIAKQLMKKNEQAKTWDDSTILLIDITGLGYSWMRSPENWAAWSKDWNIDWIESRFPVLVFTFTDLTKSEIGFFVKVNPSLSESELNEYFEVLKLLISDEDSIKVEN